MDNLTDRELMEKIAKDVSDIKLTIENEIRHNISIIAEGHSILDRKFNQSQVLPSDIEQMKLKIIYLETEIEKLKAAQ